MEFRIREDIKRIVESEFTQNSIYDAIVNYIESLINIKDSYSKKQLEKKIKENTNDLENKSKFKQLAILNNYKSDLEILSDSDNSHKDKRIYSYMRTKKISNDIEILINQISNNDDLPF